VGVVLAEAAYWGALVLMGVSFLSSLGVGVRGRVFRGWSLTRPLG